MACASCARQRAAVASNLKSGNLAGAAKETARGLGMMAGVVSKDAPKKAALSRQPFQDLLKVTRGKVTASNKDRGYGN